jgi:hypothetical protein
VRDIGVSEAIRREVLGMTLSGLAEQARPSVWVQSFIQPSLVDHLEQLSSAIFVLGPKRKTQMRG